MELKFRIDNAFLELKSYSNLVDKVNLLNVMKYKN